MPIARSLMARNTAPRLVDPYVATFTTENPLSDGGKYVMGGTDGGVWQNVQSITTGTARAHGVADSAGYDDCITHVKSSLGINSAAHYALATCYLAGGYTPPSSHEVELLVGWLISNGVARGYEVTWGFGATPAIVRWNGAIGNFTVNGSANDNLATGKGWTDTPTGTGGAALVDGDTAKVEFSIVGGSPLIIIKRNGSEVLRVADTSAFKFATGQPGMGFFARAGTGLNMASYCWKTFQAGSL